jgi:hypothetical protein
MHGALKEFQKRIEPEDENDIERRYKFQLAQ